ncbi:MAG: biotin carboxylase N-terminal domain-containing protein [Myxococcota bacterium]
MTPDLRRVLVACRGPLARRLIRAYRARGIETVAAFADADAEAPYVTEADYDAYLGEGPADRAWRDTGRLIAAAMDAGCDGIHAGTGPSASALGLHAAAAAANVTVIGPEPNRVADTLDRVRLFARARAVELPVPPIEVVGPGEEWIEVGARIGVPLISAAGRGGSTGSTRSAPRSRRCATPATGAWC